MEPGADAFGGSFPRFEQFRMGINFSPPPENPGFYFRAFIQTKLRDGSLAKTNIVALMSSPWKGGASPQKKEADALLDTFFGR